MEILKHVITDRLEILVKRTEYQKEEIISTANTQSSVAWAKKADNPKNATYEAKNIEVKTNTGNNINFGIAITRSTR
jgi:hypothetical protein